MMKYLIKRLLFMIPVLLLLSIIVFVVAQLTPGSPVDLIAGPTATQEVRDRIAAELGLDQPLPVQYLKWLSRVIRGDLGRSIVSGRPVWSLIRQALPVTVELGLAAWLLAYVVAIPIGVIAAVRRHTAWDNISMFLAIIGVTVPDFWLSLILILVFAATLKWFPIAGYGGIEYLVLPALALGAGRMAVLARTVRASMLDVLDSDHVRTARAKGLSEPLVVIRHAFRNALLPLVSLGGLQLGYLVGGAVVVEMIFARPGIGRLIVKSIGAGDFPIVQGAVLILGLSILAANLLTDILYVFVDPRIRYE